MFPLNRYSKLFLASLTLFAAMTGIIANGCASTKKTADCQQYVRGLEEAFRVNANIFRSTPHTQLSSKESYVVFLNYAAAGQEQFAPIFASFTMQEPKLRELQNKLVESLRTLSQIRRQQAQAVQSLPGEPDRSTITGTIASFNQALNDAQQKKNNAVEEMDKYCASVLPKNH